MDEAQGILDRDANVTKVENTYLRHKVMAEAEDETVLIAPETEYYEQITDIAKFLLYLLGENTIAEYKGKMIHLNRLKIGKRDGKGSKARV